MELYSSTLGQVNTLKGFFCITVSRVSSGVLTSLTRGLRSLYTMSAEHTPAKSNIPLCSLGRYSQWFGEVSENSEIKFPSVKWLRAVAAVTSFSFLPGR